MAIIRLPQNSFANGVLVEERLRGRYELKQYGAGARTLHNVNSHPQGGVYRRPGTIFKSRYTDKGTVFNMVKFDYSDEIAYMLVFYPDNIDVWANKELVHTITSTGLTSDQVLQMDYVQRANALIMVHSTMSPIRLSRGANQTTWSLSSISFSSLPLFGFNITTSNPDSDVAPASDLTPSATTGTGITFTASASVFSASNVGKYIFGPDGVARVIEYTSGTVVKAKILRDFNSTSAIASGDWTFDVNAIEVSGISGTVKITSGGSVFSADDVGGYISGNGGEARIVSYVSPFEVTARVLLNFVDTIPIRSGQWTLETGYDEAWDATVGYPRTVAFNEQDSLLFGGTKSLPDVIWKSAIGDYFNFDDTKAQPDDAMFTNLSSDDINDIRAMMPANDFLVLTSEAEFYIDGDFTPDLNFKIRKQEERGCRAFIKPVFVDGAPIYIDARADVLRELTYSDVEAKYSSTNLTLFCPGLLVDPQHLAHQRPQGRRDNDYVWIVNGDGTWVVFNTLRKQDINGFTTGSSRDDMLITCEDLNGDLYAMFKRDINGVEEYYLELFSSEVTMDCCKVYEGTSTDTIDDLGYLESEEVKIITNGFIYGETEVDDTGEITLASEYESIVVGLPFDLEVTPLPPPAQLPDGTAIGQIRRIAAVTLGFSQTGEVKVNGQPVRTRKFGEPIFDVPAPLIDGRKRVTLRGGYNRDPVVTITQTEPLPFHLTDLILEVQV